MSAKSKDDLKVCHLILPGPMAGAEKVVLAGCAALREEGVRVKLGVIRELRNPAMADEFLAAANELAIPVFDGFVSRKRVDYGLFRGIQDFFQAEQYQILHTHGYKALLYARLACSSPIGLVHTHHGDTSRGISTRLYQFLAYRQMKQIDAVCAVSHQMKEELLRRGVRPERLHLVENMLATSLNDRLAPVHRDVSKPRDLELLAIGRLSCEKGLDILIRAVADLPQPRPRITLVGEGAQEAELRRLVDELSLQEEVVFAGFQKDIVPFLARADGLVMPSLREGLPLSLIEGAVWGLPTIATNVGGIPSIVSHEKNGLLCAPNDVDAFRDCLREFVTDSQRFVDAAQQLAPTIRERFAPATWAATTCSVYRQVMEAREHRSASP